MKKTLIIFLSLALTNCNKQHTEFKVVSKVTKPITLDTIISEESDRAGIDPLLTKAIIWKESKNKSEASYEEKSLRKLFNIDQRTARGLMQVVPGWHLKPCGLESSSDLLDPRTNIRCGLKHLQSCFYRQKSPSKTKRFEGAIACYNAGNKPSPKYVKDVAGILQKMMG